MSVIRVNKTKDYTVMSNHHFRDKRLSLKAKGLLSEMLSLPNDWDYTISGLVCINKENETAIKTALRELKESGYLKVTKLLPDQTQSGRIEYIYDIYEQPHYMGLPIDTHEALNKLGFETPQVEKQGIENLGLEKQPQYNTKESNKNNKILTNKINKRFIPPKVEEVKAYCEERKNHINPENFVDFYASKGWKVGNTPMKDWKAAVRTWEQRDFGQPKGRQTTTAEQESIRRSIGDDDLPF